MIYWDVGNENAIDFLRENRDKINWEFFSRNPGIFKDKSMP